MKKLFNLVAVAVIVSAMLCACEKDTHDGTTGATQNVDDTTGATQDSDEQVPENTVQVEFDNQTWIAADFVPALQDINGVSVAQILAQKDAGADLLTTETVRIGGLPQVGESKGDFVSNSTEITVPQYDNPNIIICDYFKKDYLTNPEGKLYGNWWAKEVKWKVSAFDATSMQFYVKVKAKMFDAETVLMNHAALEDAQTVKMKVEANVILVNK